MNLRMPALLAMLPLGLGLLAAAPASGVDPGREAATADDHADTVVFELDEVTGPRSARPFGLALRCDGRDVAGAELRYPTQRTREVAHDAAGRTCEVTHATERIPGRTDELSYTVRTADGALLARTLVASGSGGTGEFEVPEGRVTVELSASSLDAENVGFPVRAMAFNIWRSGTLDDRPGGEQNLAELIEFLRSEDPDIIFMVETYGSGQQITDGLNEGLPPDRRYTGVQITREPGQAPDGDNLWLFSRFEVETVYERRGDGDLTSFNFGGARLRLPNGQRIHAFPTWLHHTDYSWGLANQSALEQVLGLPRTYTDEEVIGTDQRRRIGMATTLLGQRLPEYLAVDPTYADAPVIMAGDLNTQSALDWTGRFADAAGHAGLVLDWPVTRMFDDAGFTDTYRAANPDAARYPGRTWSPVSGFGYAPGRIDYVMTKGDDVRVLGSYTRTERLPEHQGSDIDRIYPFYSDHGAVVTDLLIRGPGAAEFRPYRTDEPFEFAYATWPDPPAGNAVPPEELTATASTENATGPASRAVDGVLTTHWHSRYDPVVDPQPHQLTIDTGRVRELSAVRYQPRIVGNMNGTLLEGTILASVDGETWTEVAPFRWERTTLPKDVDLNGLNARYLRFDIDLGIGGFSSVSEVIPYEPAG